MSFEGKVVFITGGAIGFGRAFGQAFADKGASVVIADIDTDQAEQTVRNLEAGGAKALAVRCDVADETEVAKAVADVTTHFGGIDILFNNAGLHLMKYNQPFSKLERSEFRRLLDVNVVGIVNCTLACQPSMRERGGGSVINISSVGSNLSLSPYGISKLAVRGLTIALATELASDRIRVNAISPGFMATENAMAEMPQQIIDDQINVRQLIHRLGSMDDIVAAALFLSSDDAGFITGETLRVSGGYPLFI